MQDTQFQSPFTATWNGKEYPVIILLDFVKGIVTFQDKNYHPSEIHTRPLSEVTITPVISDQLKQEIISADATAKAILSTQVGAGEIIT